MAIGRGEVREEAVTYLGVQFRVVKLEPQQVGVVWKGVDGQPYRTFDRVQTAFSKSGKSVKFLMNAGIFELGGIPSGLHVEEGKELRSLNAAGGEGNFFLQPNGVLLVEGGNGKSSAEIKTAMAYAAFLKNAALPTAGISRLRIGIQSGPMLLIGGKRHPVFQQGSPNRLLRNGVGIDSKGRIVFAITAAGQRVNLWDFAGLFQTLECENALFLDGDISQMVVNPLGPVESHPFGAMIVVVEDK
jgi:uncharacterized protein YigE (DUF2233 family)